jgi:hypothetical protein
MREMMGRKERKNKRPNTAKNDKKRENNGGLGNEPISCNF